jgi:hypothetical protein
VLPAFLLQMPKMRTNRFSFYKEYDVLSRQVTTIDGVVKSPISCVVGFYQNLSILHVLLRAW